MTKKKKCQNNNNDISCKSFESTCNGHQNIAKGHAIMQGFILKQIGIVLKFYMYTLQELTHNFPKTLKTHKIWESIH